MPTEALIFKIKGVDDGAISVSARVRDAMLRDSKIINEDTVRNINKAAAQAKYDGDTAAFKQFIGHDPGEKKEEKESIFERLKGRFGRGSTLKEGSELLEGAGSII